VKQLQRWQQQGRKQGQQLLLMSWRQQLEGKRQSLPLRQ
jgi:hypothetical protein